MTVAPTTLFSRKYTAGVLAASKETTPTECPDHGVECDGVCPFSQGWVDWMTKVVKVNADGSWSKVDV